MRKLHRHHLPSVFSRLSVRHAAAEQTVKLRTVVVGLEVAQFVDDHLVFARDRGAFTGSGFSRIVPVEVQLPQRFSILRPPCRWTHPENRSFSHRGHLGTHLGSIRTSSFEPF